MTRNILVLFCWIGITNRFSCAFSTKSLGVDYPKISLSKEQEQNTLFNSNLFSAPPQSLMVAEESTAADTDEERVPVSLKEALGVFFFDRRHPGPPVVSLSLLALVWWRSSFPIASQDAMVVAASVIFWWFQEHFLHQKLLHSRLEWYGKEIHEEHHERSYYHISIDPAPMMIVWLLTAHVALRCLLPLPMALSATLGYAGAGLFYEWTHYIVHTRVKFAPNSYWGKCKAHHMRHHLMDSSFWFGFSLPSIDNLFGTNPDFREVKKMQRKASRLT